MKPTINIILLISISLFFVGCLGCSYSDGNSIDYCKKQGYKGVASYTEHKELYCSNGDIIGGKMITASGERTVRYSVKGYEYNLIYTEFK